MKYILIDAVRGDEFNEEFENKEDALEKAEIEWAHLSEHDKKQRSTFCVIESINPDEDAENHFDGDIIKEWC